jgi:hypothetical protein
MLHKVEELGPFKARLDQRFAGGGRPFRGRELGYAYNIRRLMAYLCPYSPKCVADESSEVRGVKTGAGVVERTPAAGRSLTCRLYGAVAAWAPVAAGCCAAAGSVALGPYATILARSVVS